MDRTLVIDIGGTHVKLKLQDQDEIKKLGSGPDLTPEIPPGSPWVILVLL